MENKELKAKWVAALRSGEYKQLTPGGSFWRNDGRHCCIGVLGELLGEQQAMDTHNFRRSCPLSESETDALVGMNDRDGKTFAEIADYIEANL